jgi:hypothetical protein
VLRVHTSRGAFGSPCGAEVDGEEPHPVNTAPASVAADNKDVIDLRDKRETAVSGMGPLQLLVVATFHICEARSYL